MLKTFIAALVGAVILFIYQFVANDATKLHRPLMKYTPKQDTIMSFLNSQLSETGSYGMPNVPDNTSWSDAGKAMKANEGKPWAVISYHKTYDFNMGASMGKQLAENVIMLWLLSSILLGLRKRTFGKVFSTTLLVGIIIFFAIPLTNTNWYGQPDIVGCLVDAIVGWGLVGLWFGWRLKDKNAA